MTSAGAPAGYFQGKIDEVRVWNIVRSGTDIDLTKASEIVSAPGLIGRWSMNEGTGTTISDSAIPSEENGTLTNGPQWAFGYPFSPPDLIHLLPQQA